MKRVAIIGSTELCSRLVYYFDSTGFCNTVGMFDDFEQPGHLKYNRPILGKIDDIPHLKDKGIFDEVVIAVGYRNRDFRREVYLFLKANQIPLATFIHPSSHIENSANIGEGTIILLNCTVDINAHLHENVFLSSRCFISHDVRIRAHTFCGPTVKLAGHTDVGECCFLGISTTSINGIRIGENVQTAAGSVIVNDIPPNSLVAGVPALLKKKLAH